MCTNDSIFCVSHKRKPRVAISINKSDLTFNVVVKRQSSPLDVKVTAGHGGEGNSNKKQLPGVYVEILKQNLLSYSYDKCNRTEWNPIRSVIIRVINKIGRPRSESPICQSQVLLPINHNRNNFRKQLRPSSNVELYMCRT